MDWNSIKPSNEIESVFIDVESNLKYLNNDEKPAIRHDICHAIQKPITRHNGGNPSKIKNEINTIKFLKEKEAFLI